MTIAVDKVGTTGNWNVVGAGVTATSTLTGVAAGASILVAVMTSDQSGTAHPYASVTDGTAYTAAVKDDFLNAGITWQVELWYLHNVASGNHSVVVTTPAGVSNVIGNVVAVSFTGLAYNAPTHTNSNQSAGSTTPTSGAVTPDTASSLAFAAVLLHNAGAGTAFTHPPTGYTDVLTLTDGTATVPCEAAYLIQSSVAATNAAWGTPTAFAAANQWVGAIANFEAPVALTPTITSVNTTNIVTATQTAVAVVCTNAGASQGTGKVELIDGTSVAVQGIASWADTALSINMALGACRYGTLTLRLTTNTGAVATKTITVNPPAGKTAVNLTALRALTFTSRNCPSRYYDVPDLVDNSQMEWTRTGGSGTLTVDVDGRLAWPTSITQIATRWNSGSGWSALANWDLRGLFADALTIPDQAGVISVSGSTNLSVYFAETDAASLPLTYALTAGTLPTGKTLHTSTAIVDGTGTVVGTQSGLILTATNLDGSTTPSPNAFNFLIAASPNVSFAGTIPDRFLDLVAFLNLDVAPFFTNATSYSVMGSLPPGVSLVGSKLTGTATGIGILPGQSQTYPITIVGSNAVPSNANSNLFSLFVTNNTAVFVPQIVTIPDVSSAPTNQATAVAALQAAGFIVNVPQPWNDVRKITQYPPGGSQLATGSVVGLFLIAGSPSGPRRLVHVQHRPTQKPTLTKVTVKPPKKRK